MAKIRIGNDITVRWRLTHEGEPYYPNPDKVRLMLRNPFGRLTALTDFAVNGNMVEWIFRGSDQTQTGSYSLTLTENAGEAGMITIDTDLFTLVARSPIGEQTHCGDVDIETVTLQSDVNMAGLQGERGEKGDKGDPGEQGIQGIQGVKGEKGDKGDTGAQGERGLQGEKGERGEKGEQGLQGVQGEQGDPGYTPQRGVDYWTAQDVAEIEAAKQAAHNAAEEATAAAQTAQQAATPSGDPMHYMYETVGAVWNGDTGFWELNTLTDLTNEDMRKIIAWGVIRDRAYRYCPLRTNYSMPRLGGGAIDITGQYLCQAASNMEVFKSGAKLKASNPIQMFAFCPKLRTIIGELDFEYAPPLSTTSSPFYLCGALTSVRITRLKANIDLAYSGSIDTASILYMIQNSAATSAITIKVASGAYDRLIADEQIQAALESKPLITIAK